MNNLQPQWLYLLALFIFTMPLNAVTDQEIDAIVSKGSASDVWKSAAPERKAAITKDLREAALGRPDGTRDYDREYDARVALLNLGDDVIIQDTMRLFDKYNFQRRHLLRLMGKSTQLALIPLLAPMLARDNAQAVLTADAIFQILANSPEIDGEVRKWAKSFENEKSSKVLVSVREFWAKNSDALAAKHYGRIIKP